MTPVAILLLIVAAFLHASWNMLSKRSHPAPAFLLVANSLGCAVLLPAVVLYGRHYVQFPAEAWIFAWLTGICMAVYYAGLAMAYRKGEMSIVYPLARSSPLIVVTITTLLLGRKSEVSPACILGVVLIVFGCVLLPMKRFRDLAVRNYMNAACLLALLAAFGTAGYSMIDDAALRCLRSRPEIALNTVQVTMLYAFAEALTTTFWLGCVVVGTRNGRRDLAAVWRNQRRVACLAGVIMYVTYTIVLVSMAFVRNVSYVVAFRQLSVPVGAMFGILLFKEARPRPKLAGLVVLSLGLLLVALG